MTEVVKIGARLKDGTIISKTTELPTIFDLCFIEEVFLEALDKASLIEEGEMFDIKNHKRELLIPDGAGIIFYDFKNKKALSSQSYSHPLQFAMIDIIGEPVFGEYIKGKIDIDDDFFEIIDDFKFINEDSNRKYKMFKKIKEEGHFLSIYTNEKVNFENLNFFEAVKSLYHNGEDMFGNPAFILNDEYSRLNIYYNGWDFFIGRGTERNNEKVKKYLLDEKVLTESDLQKWIS
ncbi:hypothetical protein [Citrobacter koseri]|uniref:hypothetical protein n=1 Tax=Citrobacter koseri TaxID=545 RepID=UPI0038920676